MDETSSTPQHHMTLQLAGQADLDWAQQLCVDQHYLHRKVHDLARPLAYLILVDHQRAGCLLFGRPQCPRVKQWYGSLADVQRGNAKLTQWEMLNLYRVYILPDYQRTAQQTGQHYRPDVLPGFVDRRGEWRSTLASTAVEMALDLVVADYLVRYPPAFLHLPWQLRQCISYCQSQYYSCTLYLASAFTQVRENRGLRTYARSLRDLTPQEIHRITMASMVNEQSRQKRANQAAQEVHMHPLLRGRKSASVKQVA